MMSFPLFQFNFKVRMDSIKLFFLQTLRLYVNYIEWKYVISSKGVNKSIQRVGTKPCNLIYGRVTRVVALI